MITWSWGAVGNIWKHLNTMLGQKAQRLVRNSDVRQIWEHILLWNISCLSPVGFLLYGPAFVVLWTFRYCHWLCVDKDVPAAWSTTVPLHQSCTVSWEGTVSSGLCWATAERLWPKQENSQPVGYYGVATFEVEVLIHSCASQGSGTDDSYSHSQFVTVWRRGKLTSI